MFLYLVACTVITLLSAVTICSNILRYRELAELFYAIICVFSYVVWIYCFIVGEPTVIMQMHDILWQSQNYLLIVIVTIIVAVLYLIAYVCGLPGLKVFLFFAFVVCTHPIVMLIIHIFTIGGTVNDEESEVPLSNKDDYDYDYDYDYDDDYYDEYYDYSDEF